MKRRIITGFAVCLMLFGETGCGRNDTVYLEKASVSEDVSSGTEKIQMQTTEPETANAAGKESAQAAESDAAESATNPAGESGPARECYVYVCGAVQNAGVYALPEGSRVYEALALAGGFCDGACEDYVNQAEPVADGQMIWIPTEEEAAETPRAAEPGGAPVRAGASGGTGASDAAASDGKIDLNTADAAALMTLPGIGAAKAESILAYRDSHGGFSAVEDIMKVEGIKEGVYNRIKDYIRVN